MIKVENKGYDKTVLIFSGLAPKNHMFEWIKTFKNFEVNLIAIKDDFNCWYQKDFLKLRFDLMEIMSEIRCREFISLGGSAGGFAAIWFGRILALDKIIAFSPQSACGKIKRDLGDFRWPEFCLNTPGYDLGNYQHKISVNIFYGDDELDKLHAERFRGVELSYFDFGGHDLAKKLKEEGKLVSLLKEFIL